MSVMNTLEELEQRKKELLLRKEVAQLERSERFRVKSAAWSWWWVGPLTFIGGFCIVAAFADGVIAPAFIGILALIPVAIKSLNALSK
jgi:hypothetical protein